MRRRTRRHPRRGRPTCSTSSPGSRGASRRRRGSSRRSGRRGRARSPCLAVRCTRAGASPTPAPACGSPIASSRRRNRSIRAAGRSLGARSRKLRRGCGVVIRCSFASSRPSCAASSGLCSGLPCADCPGPASSPPGDGDCSQVPDPSPRPRARRSPSSAREAKSVTKKGAPSTPASLQRKSGRGTRTPAACAAQRSANSSDRVRPIDRPDGASPRTTRRCRRGRSPRAVVTVTFQVSPCGFASKLLRRLDMNRFAELPGQPAPKSLYRFVVQRPASTPPERPTWG